MGFSTKRGRPKKLTVIDGNKPETDFGTVELQAKRALGATKEPIDTCKEKDLVNEKQYAAALHFRWLYTIRFGAPGVSAVDLENYHGGHDIRDFDEAWQAKREQEYAMSVEKLRMAGALKLVMNIVVFNHKPQFLSRKSANTHRQIIQNSLELEKFRMGLTVLAELQEKGLRPKIQEVRLEP